MAGAPPNHSDERDMMTTTNEEAPATEKVLAQVTIDGDCPDLPLVVATLTRDNGTFWVERLLARRTPHASFELAMADIERVALAYNGSVRSA